MFASGGEQAMGELEKREWAPAFTWANQVVFSNAWRHEPAEIRL